MPDPQNEPSIAAHGSSQGEVLDDLGDALEPVSDDGVAEANGAQNGASFAPSSPPATGLDMITRLRAEADATNDPARQAVLLHEAAELEERAAGDELGAAREYLAAYNADGSFREPLEALLRILERRRSMKNLGRVLDSLAKAAETAEERARALRALADDAIAARDDRDGARDWLEQAVDADPTDATAWTFLELDAALRGDAEARARALARRVELASDPRWQALLRVDLAAERAQVGEIDDALDVLVEVVTSPDEAAFRACEVAERIARKGERTEREAWALVQRGEIVLESLADPPGPRAGGVPRALRRAGVAADAFVRAATCYRTSGRIEDEIASLDRAIAIDPNATTPYLARIAAASRLGDVDRAAEIARGLLDRGARPELASHLWLAVTEAALARGDRQAVLDACARLLESSREGDERTAVVPRTLLIDLLLDGSEPERLATLLEADASARPSAEGRARGWLVAATVRALVANDAEGARTALAQALAEAATPVAVARLGAALAATTPDGAGGRDAVWWEATLRALRDVAPDPAERSELDLDRARARLTAGDQQGAVAALASIPLDGPRGAVGRIARLALGGDAAGDDLLEGLSAVAEPEATLAFAIARAVRAIRRDEPATRAAALAALGAASEDEPLAALVRAGLIVEQDAGRGAEILRELSRTAADPETRDVLRIAAAVLLVRAAVVPQAVELLDELETDAAAAVAPARAIFQRHLAREADDEARRAAIEVTARDVLAPGGFGTLERTIDRLAHPEADGPSAEDLLQELARASDPAIARAALILQAFWPDANVTSETREGALGAVEALGEDAARKLARAGLRRASRDADGPTAILAAEAWHRAGGGVPAAFEILIAAEQAADSEAEVRGRLALAAVLEGAPAVAVAASASIAAHVAGLPVPPPPPPRDPETVATVALVEAELAAPGCEPTRRERALRGLADVLGEGAGATLQEMAAWSALARGDHASARALFARSLELAQLGGDEPRSALEGAIETELLSAGGRPTAPWAELVERLARLVERRGDVAGAAALWEQVGHAWWDALGDPARGERALAESFARDKRRRAAFERIFRAVRARKEDDRLLELVGRRLESTDDPPEMAKLFWEQARVLRAKGDRDAALSSLENVTMLEPDHVGALALSAEIYVGRQMYAEAASALDRLSRQPVPVQQKLGAGLGAADLYESKLEAPDKALDVLLALDRAGLSSVPIHERIARAAARAQAWVPATTYLEKLVRSRGDAKGRIEAARLSAVIYRDRLDDPAAAVPSLVVLLREAPDDAEAVEQLLESGVPAAQIRESLLAARGAARAILAQSPTDARYARIVARISAALGDLDMQQLALGVLVATDAATDQERQAAAGLVARLGTAPAVALDPANGKRLTAAEDSGALLDLFRLMAPTIAEALGPTLEAMGVGRRERVDARSGSALRNEVAAWAGALGLTEFELYHGGRDPEAVQGVPAETPAVVIGSSVRSPLSLVDRARLVRELFALVRGTTIVLQRDDVAVAAVIVASCAIAEVPLQTPAYAVLAETQRLLTKAIGRRTRKALPEVAQAVARQLGGGGDLRTFRAHALRTLDRAAIVAVGEPSAALAGIVGPGAAPARVVSDLRAAANLRFAWSDDFFVLRKQLGLGIG
jgi:tetratricopeptide (TPR) repeat protein